MHGGAAGSRENGFTLLEVLVAVVVLGLLVLALSQGVRTGLVLRQAQVQRVGETAELDAAMRLLRGVFTRVPAAPQGRQPTPSDLGARFRGEADSVSLVGELPSGLGPLRRAEMTLHVRDRRLILSWTPYRHERPFGPPPGPTDTELLAGVVRLDLAYWTQHSPDQPGSWQSRWEEPEPPELVRIRLVFPENDRRRWPDLIAAPSP